MEISAEGTATSKWGNKSESNCAPKSGGQDLNGNAEMMAAALETCLKSRFARMRRETEGA